MPLLLEVQRHAVGDPLSVHHHYCDVEPFEHLVPQLLSHINTHVNEFLSRQQHIATFGVL
jgi:hypothetical protein